MSLVQLYEDVHKRKDGSFISGTLTEDFLVDARSKAEVLEMMDGTKSRKVLEDEAFEATMYGGQLSKRPQGFGFGVVKGSVYGVHGLVRKEGSGKVYKRPVHVEDEDVKLKMCALNSTNAKLEKKNEELTEAVNRNTRLLMSLVEAMRSGNATAELLDAAQASLHATNPKVTMKVTNISSTPGESDDFVPSSSKQP